MKQEEKRAGLLELLEMHRKSGYLSLHMPGHKENEALAPYLARLGAGLDVTELPGLDDLHAPEGVLARGMDRASALWGSRRSLFQVNGSTGGLLAAMRAATRRGDKILLARHCHKSLYHGAELCGLEPVYLLPPVEPTFGLAGSITPRQVAEALDANPGVTLVVYPSPTYDGVLSDTAGICREAHRRGAAVLVDEAHGAHLGLSPLFPPNAVQQGADLAVASLHKMLPSLTQTAILHVGDGLVSPEEAARQAGIFQSSSPSYLLMASMDCCVALLEEQGEGLFAAWRRRLADFDRLTADLTYLRLPGHGREAGAEYPGVFGLDPAKILISTRGTRFTGVGLMDSLAAEDRIELEMAMGHYAVAMTGLGTGDDMAPRLSAALHRLDKLAQPADSLPPVPPMTLPPARVRLEEAARLPAAPVPLDRAVDRVAGEYIWAYPPGIPLVAPGEVLTAGTAADIRALARAGVKLVGTRGNPPATAAVLTAEP